MKAMIFAAGLGTRLRPLTNHTPKALIEVQGRPLLEWVIRKLAGHGVSDIIINTHHFAEQVEAFVQSLPDSFPAVTLSHEPQLLDTGGGLKKAAWFFDDGTPFILHNSDVLSDIDLTQMVQEHRKSDAAITLAVRERKTSRYLLFNGNSRLCGHRDLGKGKTIWINDKEKPDAMALSFCGIHVISPAVLKELPPVSAYPILPAYLELAEAGYLIRGYDTSASRWIDLGKKESLERVGERLPEGYFKELLKIPPL